ncbi:MAG: hypothetical protein JNK04_09670 [Myxococcales bacterium]|nr:hypothetical protein [Myxococcales bacterium]
MAEGTFLVDASSDLEVSLIHGALLLVAVLVAKQLEQIASALFEARPGAPPSSAKLALGKLPLGSDLDRVALVRGGVPALAELVRERAFIEGWLKQDEKGLAVGAAVPGEASLSTALRAALPFARASEADLERASRAVAAKYHAESALVLESAGLLPGAVQRAAGLVAYALPAVGVLVLGFLRAMRAVELGSSTAPALAQLFLSALVLAFFARGRRQTQAGERYIAWLREATDALREDLTSGSLTRREDFLLLIAVHGAAGLDSGDRARTADRFSTTSEQNEGGGGTG